MLNKKKRMIFRRGLFKLASFVCFLVGVSLVALLILSGNENVQHWWQSYQDYLVNVQVKVENMTDKGYLFFTLMFLFAFKAFIPLYPLSILCASSGVVFPVYIAVPVNLLGMMLHYTIKYVWGKRMGPGGANLILKKNETIRKIMKADDAGNPWLLALFRLIPFVPVNPVSQLYGAMGFPFIRFLLLSLLGYLPLLCSYTIVGRNVYNPLSAGFLLPLIILAFATSAVAYVISLLMNYTRRRNQKNVNSQSTYNDAARQ